MPESVFESCLFPVGRGAQGSSILFIPAARLKESSPEPVLPTSFADGSAMTRAYMGAERMYGSESYVSRNRQSISKGNRSSYSGNSRTIAFDRLLHSKPEDLLSCMRRMFRQTSVPDSGKMNKMLVLPGFRLIIFIRQMVYRVL